MTDASSLLPLQAGAVLLIAVVVPLTRRLTEALLFQMVRAGFVAANFEGRRIPKSGGAAPIVVAGAALLCWRIFPARISADVVASADGLLLALFAFALVGFVDDVAGDRSAGGLRGHWRRLAGGELTTGGLKALFGIGAAFALTAPASASWPEWFLNAFLVAAYANGANLLDVRPGRALKGCLLAVIPVAALTWTHPGWLVASPALAAFAAFAPDDAAGRAMLGDAGANGAGALVGMTAVIVAGPVLKLTLALAAAALHGAAERGSISVFIERTPLLRRLDRWGRRPVADAGGQEPSPR